jgi:hypothetical protein
VLRIMPATTMHRISAVLLGGLAIIAAWSAVRG